jgi:hypothetical protein
MIYSKIKYLKFRFTQNLEYLPVVRTNHTFNFDQYFYTTVSNNDRIKACVEFWEVSVQNQINLL